MVFSVWFPALVGSSNCCSGLFLCSVLTSLSEGVWLLFACLAQPGWGPWSSLVLFLKSWSRYSWVPRQAQVEVGHDGFSTGLRWGRCPLGAIFSLKSQGGVQPVTFGGTTVGGRLEARSSCCPAPTPPLFLCLRHELFSCNVLRGMCLKHLGHLWLYVLCCLIFVNIMRVFCEKCSIKMPHC